MIKNLLFTISFIILGINISNGQSNMGYVASKYCRSNPYTGTFSNFLNHLVSDPSLKNKEEIKKSDSTLYSFSGFYTTHQPFGFKSDKVQVSLWEESILLSDTLSLRDTVINYLISAYLPNTPANQKIVKKEVTYIYSRNKRFFAESSVLELKNKKNESTGGGYNMFLLMHGIAPLSIAWQLDEKKEEISLHLLFRLSNSSNVSETPLPLFKTFY